MADDSCPPAEHKDRACGCSGRSRSETRRMFLSRLGWGAFFVTIGASLAGTLRFLFPRVLFEPPSIFKVGRMDEFPAGPVDKHGVVSVSEKFMVSNRVWIVREADKLYAIFGKCTHLGCTPKWFADDRTFKCPCHGSNYYSNGINFAGPAPRPMDRYGISLLDDGRIEVNSGELYPTQKFNDPRSFIRIA